MDKFLKNTRHRSHSSGSRSDGGDYSYSEDEGDYSDDSEDNRKPGSATKLPLLFNTISLSVAEVTCFDHASGIYNIYESIFLGVF